MAVKRKHKGVRAGGKKSRPASRNNRVRVHANLKNIAKVNKPNLYFERWKSKEDMVIHWATIAVGTRAGRGFVRADDVVSDILLELLDAGGFDWTEEEVRSFCFKRSHFMVRAYLAEREVSACELSKDSNYSDFDGGSYADQFIKGIYPPRQHLQAYANQMRKCLFALPDHQKKALLILCDGGNPIDVSEELGVTPALAITIIREARRFVHMVEPDWQDWR